MEYVMEVYRQKSFTKAADQLHIAQPSLSQQIKKLEEELDTPYLFESMDKSHPHLKGVGSLKGLRTFLRKEMICCVKWEKQLMRWGKS